MPFLSQVAVRRVGGSRAWQLLEDLCYLDPLTGLTFTAPAGYRTDWATRPRLVEALFSWAMPKLGPWDEPAVTHDLGCDALADEWKAKRANRERAAAGLPPLPVRRPWLDSRGVDQLWRRALRDVGVGAVLALLLWAAVRWGALGSRYRWAGWWRDAPAVLALTALAALVLSAVVRVLDAGVHRLADLI